MCCTSTCSFNLGRIPGKIVFLVWHRLQQPQQLLLALKFIANELQHLNWKQLLCGPLEIVALDIATLTPQRYMYQKGLNWMQWHRVLRVRLCLLSTVLQELIAQRDYESTPVLRAEKKMFPTVSPALSGLLLCSQCALKRPVSVSINSVTLSGDILSKIYKVHDRIWFISPCLFS